MVQLLEKGLSVRARKFISIIGGYKKALEIYKNEGTFLKYSYIGRKTNSELIDFFSEYDSNSAKKVDEQIELSETKTAILIEKYRIAKEESSTRVINFLLSAENLENFDESTHHKKEFIKKYFLSDFKFETAYRIGQKSVQDLLEIKRVLETIFYIPDHYLLKNTKTFEKTELKLLQADKKDRPSRDFFIGSINELERALINEDIKEKYIIQKKAKFLINNYLFAKKNADTRATNVLNFWEKVENFELGSYNQILFIKKYFFGEMMFDQVRSVGPKTLGEIEEIRTYIEDCIIKINDDDFIKLQDKIYENNQSFSQQVANHLKRNISIDFIQKYENEPNPFNFFCSVLIELLLNSTVKTQHKQILMKHYFSDHNISNKEISNLTGLSRERVRQIIVTINKEIIPQTILSLKSAVEDTHMSLNNFVFEEIIEINTIDIECKPPLSVKPNANFFVPVFQTLLGSYYTKIDNIIFQKNYQFYLAKNHNFDYFILNSLASRTRLNFLIEWTVKQMLDFEMADFDYSIDTLVRRFYSENNFEIAPHDLKKVTFLISNIRKSMSIIEDSISKKAKKNRDIQEIISSIDLFIRSNNTSKKTSEILDHLTKNFFDINLYQLLTILRRNKNIFKAAGSGFWGAPELVQTEGSLRSIVTLLLTKSELPLHISEISDHLSTFRSVDKRSVWSNLKQMKNNPFVFFNCMFIGLKVKKYEPKWFNLPRFIGSKLHVALKSNKTIDEVVLELDKIHNYPEIHVRYLLSKKSIVN